MSSGFCALCEERSYIAYCEVRMVRPKPFHKKTTYRQVLHTGKKVRCDLIDLVWKRRTVIHFGTDLYLPPEVARGAYFHGMDVFLAAMYFSKCTITSGFGSVQETVY